MFKNGGFALVVVCVSGCWAGFARFGILWRDGG